MNFRGLTISAAAAGLMAVATAAHAVPTVTLHGSNVGIDSGSFSVVIDTVGRIVTINETWTSAGTGALLFQGFDGGGGLPSWQVRKNMINSSGSDFTRLANELLDILGDGDDGDDPLPYPTHVPAGFSTSNNFDGLTYSDARTSDIWSSTLVDEVSHARDFTDFFNGTLSGAGGSGYIEMRLFDLANGGDFLWQERPNAVSVEVPEPAALALLGFGLIGLRLLRRHKPA